MALKLKSSTSKEPRRVAFVGNPNAGKSTLFNAVTGSDQKVGNYPGVTVERVSAFRNLGDFKVEFIDVPGLYSLDAVSEDEAVAVSVVQGVVEPVDLIVCVVDGSNLERNLFLFSQLAELKMPVLIALTMTDRIEKKSQDIDLELLSTKLGCDVIPLVGHRDIGIEKLLNAIETNLQEPKIGHSILKSNAEVASLRERLARIGFDVSEESLVEQIQESSPEFDRYFTDFPELHEDYQRAKAALERGQPAISPTDRYRWSGQIQSETIKQVGQPSKELTLTDKIDLILTHRVLGLIVFIGVMYLVFQSIYSFSKPLMDGIGSGFDWLKGVCAPPLNSWPILQSLVVDGIIGGIGSVLVFLPQIVILFFFIAFLEGTGYLARAAFLMDRLLGWCGLNGRAFIPLLSSFACAIPGIMAARVMPDPKSRLATILVAPLMSCSARFPVYILLVGAFIEPKFGAFWAGFTFFAMHLLGLLVAIPIVLIFNKGILKGKRLPFLLELPPYQMPKWRDVFLAMYNRGKVFVMTAGTTIFVMSVLIWAGGYFPRLPEAKVAEITRSVEKDQVDNKLAEAQLEYSTLGRFGKSIEPAFLPLGFDWRISTAIISAFPARETVVPSLGILFSLGNDAEADSVDLKKSIQGSTWPDGRPLFTPWTAVGLMIFFALCAQCVSTLATVKRETNSVWWPIFMFVYMTTLAYLAAWFVNWLGTR